MRAILLISGLVIPLSLYAQEPRKNIDAYHIWETGLPGITRYTPEEYKAAAQNWDFIQGDGGTMYVGNSAGILEFDGVSWRQIKLPNSGRVTSFAKGSDGTIYTGGSRDFGYLRPDSLGQMQFHSFLPELDKTYHDFTDVWHTYAVQDTIYFITEKYMFQWADSTFTVILPKGIFGFAFLVEGNIYIDDRGTGIMQVKGNTTTLIPDGEIFSAGGITAMCPVGENKILMIHALDGAYIYNKNKIVQVSNEWIENITTYGSTLLPNGDFLIYTIGDGAYIFDAGGKLKQRLNKDRGLTSDVIYGAYTDREGGLWLAGDHGINRVEISSPIRFFNDVNGLDRSAQNVLITSFGMYVSTNDGLYYYLKSKLGFKRIPEIGNMTRDLVPIEGGILAGNLNALYRVDHQNQVYTVKFGGDSFNILLKSTIDTTKVYVAGNSGNIYLMDISGRDLQLDERIFRVEGSIIQIIETPDSSLWLNTRYNGIFRAYPKGSENHFTGNYKITHYERKEGLPALNNNYLFQLEDNLYASTQEGMYRLAGSYQYFRQDTTLTNQLDLRDMDTGPVEVSDNIVWFTVKSDFQNTIFKIENNVVHEVKATRRFSDFQISNIYDSSAGIIFFSGPKGLYAYNMLLDTPPDIAFQTQIRMVLFKDDSLIFGGHDTEEKKEIALPFENNAIRFSYSLPSYDKPEANEYQYYLEGFDKNWSDWTVEAQRDFTNLLEGEYSFRVRGRNVYENSSSETSFSFVILTPWYRSWWSYLLYGIFFLALIGLIVQWRSVKLRREKKTLENIIKKRTAEVREKNKQLRKQAEKLKELDYQKSQFFANISHEFRTPLTLIKSPVENILGHPEETMSLQHIQMIGRSADRLLRLVNQLLDLSKLDANTLRLVPTPGDIFKFLRVLSASFRSHAEHREICYQVLIPEQAQPALFDHDKLENIVYNLLSNAFKFTSGKGKITLTASIDNHTLEIEVADTGIGIPTEHQFQIFDRFYQGDNTPTREQQGAGIGLAMVKELILLMDGSINVKSRPGAGSKFSIRIPVTIMEDHILETAEDEWPSGDMDQKKIIQPSGVLEDTADTKNSCMILIVEDNADMRQLISDMLASSYNLLKAGDGVAGWETCVAEVPDLVITDLMMPKMDGRTMCRKIKMDERTSHIPVIMLTAKADQEHKIKGLEVGADSYLSKPFDRNELQVRIRNLIRQRQQLREKYSQTVSLEPENMAVSSLDEQFLQKVKYQLEKNFSNPEFGAARMQEELVMSKTQLHRKMKALTGQPPGEFLRNYRLKRAARILEQQGDTVTQVAYAVGFNNLSYFSKCFKELHGVAPSQYGESVQS